MKRYTFEDLETLPPDHVFSKITDKMMKCDGNTKSQNKVRWAEEWLKRREDKMPSTIRISQNISIQDAFNQLSNEQLNKWINIYRKKVHKHQDNCTQKEAVTTYQYGEHWLPLILGVSCKLGGTPPNMRGRF